MPTFRVPLAVLAGAVAALLVLAATEPPGPGLDPDAVSYVSAAQSFARHGTLRVPDDGWANLDSTMALAHFPPGYPVVLALPVALGLPAVQGARAVNAVAALVTVAVLAWLVFDAAGVGAGLLLALVLVATPALAAVHENVLSEPLFLTLIALLLLVMTRGRRPLLSGLAAAGAALVRYAGLFALPAVALWWLLQPGRALRERVRDALVALLPGLAAMGAWAARTGRANREESIRHLGIYGQLGPTLHEGAATLTRWLAPSLDGWWRRLAALAAALLVVGLLHAASRRERRAGAEAPTRAWRLMLAAACLAVMYAGLVLVSRLVADPGIPLDERLLSPLFLLAEVAVVLALASGWRVWRRRTRLITALLVAGWVGAAAADTLDAAQYALETGNDYADERWAGSSLIAWVRSRGTGREVFTNAPAALYFHAGRMARELPGDLDPASTAEFADTVQRRHGLIVVFDLSTTFVHPSSEVLARLPVRELVRFPDGAVYEMGAPAPAQPARPPAPATPPGATRPPASAPRRIGRSGP